MIDTYFATDTLGSGAALLVALLLGFGFGFSLERAGFGSSRKLAGIFYFRDMTVLKVMFTAVVTAMLGLSFAVALGITSLDKIFLMPTFWGAQIVGGLLFGVGFVASGWCPGTAAVGVASGKTDALIFLGGATLGSILYNELYGLVGGLASWGASGTRLAWIDVGVGRGTFAFFFSLVAVAAFWGAEWVERRAGGEGRYWNSNFLRGLSVVIITAALGAAIAGDAPATAAPALALSSSSSSESALMASVMAEDDHLDPEDLADLMVKGDRTLWLVDVRPAAEFARFALPGAVNVPLTDVHRVVTPATAAGRRVVMISSGQTHAAQARDSLARTGVAGAVFLTDGLTGFVDRCLTPASLRPSPLAPAQAAKVATWRAFFLAAPSASPAPSPASSSSPPSSPPQEKTGQATPSASLSSPIPLTLGAVGDARGSVVVDASGIGLPGLVDGPWLLANASRADLRVIDVRAQPAYNGAHVPGSVSLQPESLRGNRGGIPSMLHTAPLLGQIFGAAGIGRDDTVVIVPGDKLHDATLVAMALERLGHRRYAILQGGYDAWRGVGGVPTSALPAVASVEPETPRIPTTFTVDAAAVAGASGRAEAVLDVRPVEYYTGAKVDEARGGHIPGALNRPFDKDLVSGHPTCIRPLTELAAEYAAALPPGAPVIVHCRTGHQASQTWFVLHRLLGRQDVSWYDGGWTEWAARSDLPVATGPDPR